MFILINICSEEKVFIYCPQPSSMEYLFNYLDCCVIEDVLRLSLKTRGSSMLSHKTHIDSQIIDSLNKKLEFIEKNRKEFIEYLKNSHADEKTINFFQSAVNQVEENENKPE